LKRRLKQEAKAKEKEVKEQALKATQQAAPNKSSEATEEENIDPNVN
jgi:hypothetical protein